MKGTLYYMALEVVRVRYRFLPAGTVTKPPFRHNALHEMESLWLIALWLIMAHGVDPTSDTSYNPNRQYIEYRRLFPADITIRNSNDSLPQPDLEGPEIFLPAIVQLMSVRDDLIRWYTTAELPLRNPVNELNLDIVGGAYSQLIKHMEALQQMFEPHKMWPPLSQLIGRR
jgi:hypothetical protein